MRGIGVAAWIGAAVLAFAPRAEAADGALARIEAGRAAYARGDLARSASELEQAVAELHARLGKTLAEFLPPPPAGWQGEAAETQGLSGTGGGLAVTRAYSRGESTLNASLIIDSPAVSTAAVQFAANAPGQPNIKRVKVGAEEALMRWDGGNRAGEITVVLGGRAVLQIVGDGLGGGDALAEAAQGWNVAAIRKLLGIM